ncbi:hypothetical protein B0H13DRAFT_315102 [Mycena leptocephala]|nr:hypothetical protein B0H13DRAFT_315102 [Mycena leptocephala]
MSQDARRQVQRDLPGRIRQLNADLTAALASDSPGTVQFANELAPEIQHLQASLNSRTPRAPPPLKDVRNPVKKGAGKKKKDKEEEIPEQSESPRGSAGSWMVLPKVLADYLGLWKAQFFNASQAETEDTAFEYLLRGFADISDDNVSYQNTWVSHASVFLYMEGTVFSQKKSPINPTHGSMG